MSRSGSLASPGIWNLMKLPSMTRWSRPDPAIDGEAIPICQLLRNRTVPTLSGFTRNLKVNVRKFHLERRRQDTIHRTPFGPRQPMQKPRE